MQSNRITSRQNPQVVDAVHLRDKKSYRNKRQAFVVEGLRELKRAFEAGWKLERLFFCEAFLKSEEAISLVEAIQGAQIPCFFVSENVFTKLSQRQGPDGILGVVGFQAPQSLESLQLSACPLLLVAESIEKPGNLGSLIRTAEGVGVDALILCNPLADIYNPNTIRNAQGALFTQTVLECSEDALWSYCKAHGIQLLATTPDAKDLYFSCPLNVPTALLVGNEHHGLSDSLLERVDCSLRIPMAGASDSLNVNVAASVVLYETIRQRTS